jgi:cation diffusion facilitator family transporter
VPREHETRTRWVVVLTLLTMGAELVVGYATNSLALTADGWHMATHAGALGLAAFAYWFARQQAGSSSFSFGTGKVPALAGYTNAVALGLVAGLMVVEAGARLLEPEPIAFDEALPVAVLGLLVNLLSAKLLHGGAPARDEHHHDDDHDRGHGHAHAHAHDHNLRAAYLHVLADALTSVLAILALLGGRQLGVAWLDPAMGAVGGVVIARWSYGLCRAAAAQLLDVVPSADALERLRTGLAARFPDARVLDLHLWELGPATRACVVSLASPSPRPTAEYRAAVAELVPSEHLTVEVLALEQPAERPAMPPG